MAAALVPAINLNEPLTDQTGKIRIGFWATFFQTLVSAIQTLNTSINQVISQGSSHFTIATQPTLGAADANFVGFLDDFNHFVLWTGTVWKFAPGDGGNGFFSARPLAPQEGGWALCDGSVTSYVVVGGASLTTANFTTPDAKNNPLYLKSGAVYDGTVVAPTAPTIANAGTHNHTGATGNESAHTHGAGTYKVAAFQTSIAVQSGAGITTLDNSIDNAVSGSSGAGSAHSHSIGNDGDHAHTMGTNAEPRHLGAVLLYFRR